MLKQLRVLALLAASMIVACASVDAKKITKFGEATAAVAQIASDVPVIADYVATQAAFENQAMFYEGRSSKTVFPPKVPDPDVELRKRWAVRVSLLNAISSYGSALAEAASGGDSVKLDSALGNLKKAVSAAQGLAQNDKFQGAASFVQSGGKHLFLHVSDARLRQFINEAHPLIVQSAALLSEDFRVAEEYIEADYQNWVDAKEIILAEVRIGGSSADRYLLYHQFSMDSEAMEAKVALFRPRESPRYRPLLSKMVAAHAELRKPNAKPATIEDFVSAVEEMAGSLKQLNSK